jgi:sensor histidine kinase regulating citrate/malate metabolism
LLKICNNGRPIDKTNEDYRTRGVFSGTTGHTGLGGYQISKYAEILGGYVELPQEKEWNTEIHLYIKK